VFVEKLLSGAQNDRVASVAQRYLLFVREFLNNSARSFYPFLIKYGETLAYCRTSIIVWNKIRGLENPAADRERLSEVVVAY
jgi:hypothetical protein